MPQSRRQVCKLLVKTLACAAIPVLAQRRSDASGRQPRFNITETYARTLVRTGSRGQYVYETVESGKFRLNVRIPMLETDITTFSGATSVTVEIEDASFGMVLADDPAYTAGKTRAQVIRTAPGPKGDPIPYQSITLTWTSKEMRIRIDALTPDQVEPLFGWDFLDRLTGRYSESSEATVTVADIVINFQLDLSGKTVSRDVTRNEEVFELSTTSIKGKVFDSDWEG